MENKSIPSSILANGISKEGFIMLLNDIKIAVISEGIDNLNQYDSILEVLRKNEPGNNTEEWITRFEKQISESNSIIKDNYNKIEKIFNKIFEDWEEYKKNNDISQVDMNENVGDKND